MSVHNALNSLIISGIFYLTGLFYKILKHYTLENIRYTLTWPNQMINVLNSLNVTILNMVVSSLPLRYFYIADVGITNHKKQNA